MIVAIKKLTSAPLILLQEKYNPAFVKNAFRYGIDDIVDLQHDNLEVSIRTIWNLQKQEIRQVSTRNKKILQELGVINNKTGFYSTRYNKKILQNEIEYLKSRNADGIIIAIEPNKVSRLSPSNQNIVDTLKNNLRETDVITHTKYANTFYILLENTNFEGAMIVWNRINQNIGAEETLCGCVTDIANINTENIDAALKDGLINAQNAPNFMYIISLESNDSTNWLENINIIGKNKHKNFKLFKLLFNKKLENIIKPTIEKMLEEYKYILANTQMPITETKEKYSIKFIHKKQESEFSITQDSNTVIIDFIHNGLDSPENKSLTINLNEISKAEIESNFEDFIFEFKTCL